MFLRSLATALGALLASSLAFAQTPPARVHHAQTVLSDGRVLVSGGETADDLVAFGAGAARALRRDALLFDPATGRWSPAGRMLRPRTNHVAVTLPDGSVVVLGGGPNTFHPDVSVERWEPSSQTWRAAGSLARGRFGHTATALQDGRVLVVGGAQSDVGGMTPGSNVLRDVELWDPRTARATPAAPLPVALVQHTATRLADGRVLVTGGTSWWGGAMFDHDVTSPRAFVWDPARDAWREVGPMHGARASHAAALLADGRVLVVGNRVGHDQTACSWTDHDCASRTVRGDDADVYDPRTETFTAAAATRFPRVGGHQLARLRDGRVAVFGVLSGVGASVPQVVEVWDPTANTWSDHGDDVLTETAGFRVAPLADGRVLLTGAVFAPTRGGLQRARTASTVWVPAAPRVPARESTLRPAVLE